jgi:hypothetical protein
MEAIGVPLSGVLLFRESRLRIEDFRVLFPDQADDITLRLASGSIPIYVYFATRPEASGGRRFTMRFALFAAHPALLNLPIPLQPKPIMAYIAKPAACQGIIFGPGGPVFARSDRRVGRFNVSDADVGFSAGIGGVLFGCNIGPQADNVVLRRGMTPPRGPAAEFWNRLCS